MEKLKIGVLGPSEIAFRRTVPGIKKSKKLIFSGVACASAKEKKDEKSIKKSKEKALKFKQLYGGKIYNSYTELLEDIEIDAVYIPLPPSLHYFWAEKALKYGKHIFLEKPFTATIEETKKLINLAKEKKLAVHENYAFLYHKQIEEIKKIIKSNKLGELRFIRTAFCFPYRGETDFRYHKSMGGGSLTDCAGYPIRISNEILGDCSQIVDACLLKSKNADVDVYGNVVMRNEEGLTSQILFGMDNSYKCEIEICGSLATLYTDRVFTPPSDMKPIINIKSNKLEQMEVDSDDQFQNSAEYFYSCILDENKRMENYKNILKQAENIEKVRCLANEK